MGDICSCPFRLYLADFSLGQSFTIQPHSCEAGGPVAASRAAGHAWRPLGTSDIQASPTAETAERAKRRRPKFWAQFGAHKLRHDFLTATDNVDDTLTLRMTRKELNQLASDSLVVEGTALVIEVHSQIGRD